MEVPEKAKTKDQLRLKKRMMLANFNVNTNEGREMLRHRNDLKMSNEDRKHLQASYSRFLDETMRTLDGRIAIAGSNHPLLDPSLLNWEYHNERMVRFDVSAPRTEEEPTFQTAIEMAAMEPAPQTPPPSDLRPDEDTKVLIDTTRHYRR